MNVIPQNLTLKYINTFNELGWIDLEFGTKSKSLLARLNPRIDTEKEAVLISTYPSKRKPWISSIAIDNCIISDVSIVITDRRIVLLNRSDDRVEEFYFSQLDRWERSGYSGVVGKATYKLGTKDRRVIEIVIQAQGSGWLAALAGFSNPVASAETQRGGQRVRSFMDFFDSFVQTIYNASRSSVL